MIEQNEELLVEEYMMLLQTQNGGKVIVDTRPALKAQLTKLNKLGWMSPDECQECQAQTECKIEVVRKEIARLEKKLDDREADLIEAKREERERIREMTLKEIRSKMHHTRFGLSIEEEDWKALGGEYYL